LSEDAFQQRSVVFEPSAMAWREGPVVPTPNAITGATRSRQGTSHDGDTTVVAIPAELPGETATMTIYAYVDGDRTERTVSLPGIDPVVGSDTTCFQRATTGECRAWWQHPRRYHRTQAAYSPTGERVVFGASQYDFVRVLTSEWRPQGSPGVEERGVAVEYTNTRAAVLTAPPGGALTVRDTLAGRELRALAFSEDGEEVAYATRSGSTYGGYNLGLVTPPSGGFFDLSGCRLVVRRIPATGASATTFDRPVADVCREGGPPAFAPDRSLLTASRWPLKRSGLVIHEPWKQPAPPRRMDLAADTRRLTGRR
jgi:hypothetical protein